MFISYKRVNSRQNFNLEICTNNQKFKQREREKTFNCIPPKKKKRKTILQQNPIFLPPCILAHTFLPLRTYIPSKSGISYSFNPLERRSQFQNKVRPIV